MGEVYRAKDTRLERTVAVKVLPQHLSSAPEVRQRFEREAKTISQFSHSHICALYDVGREGETEYLVMEFLEGETLSDRLAKGALPLEQTLRYGVEIADALDKAHRQGIVHRDLKPGNVMITKSGVKLLDFGLAKAMTPPEQKSGVTSLPTVMGSGQNLTQEGTILGTFQYMAPEQLEGREADGRTDIFAFGCLLYEMATGRKAFTGGTQASLISSIMKEDPPPISQVTPMSPPALDRVVRKSLAKDPEDRWQNAADLGSELKWIAEGGSSQIGVPVPVTVTAKRRAPWIPAAAALVALVAGFAAAWALRRPPAAPVVRSSIDLPPKTVLEPFNTAIALSPDGQRFVYSATGADGKRGLWIRSLDALDVQLLAGTEGAITPFWSPDSRFIGFFADHKLKKIAASGGSAQTICDAADGRGASWSQYDVIVFAPSPFTGLSRVSASGGTPVVLTEVKTAGQTHRLPWFLPDGKHLLYLSGSNKYNSKENSIWALDIDSRKSVLVAQESSEGRYVEPGYLAFVREGNVMLQPFDTATLKTTGDPVPVAEKVQFAPLRWSGGFTFSKTGLLVVQPGTPGQKRQLTWYDLDGKALDKVGDPAPFQRVVMGPDDRRAATTLLTTGLSTMDLWIYDLARGVASRFSFGNEGYFNPVWTPDGKQVAYGRADGVILVKPADASGEAKTIASGIPNPFPASWSPDGRFLAIGAQNLTGGGIDIWIVPVDGSQKPYPLIATAASERESMFSPDGKWIAYISDESGRPEVYAVPFPGPGERRLISTTGTEIASSSPMWTPDGRQILYVASPDRKLIAVDVGEKDGALEIGESHVRFGGQPVPEAPIALAHDGKRLLVAVPSDDRAGLQLMLVNNWIGELKKK
jgi:Tol biopolymer transport system component